VRDNPPRQFWAILETQKGLCLQDLQSECATARQQATWPHNLPVVWMFPPSVCKAAYMVEVVGDDTVVVTRMLTRGLTRDGVMV
jgi:hypothetical protein